MTIQTIINDIHQYGYLIIFVFLFCGIIGIPAPEESLLILIGVMIVHQQLSFILAWICAILGIFIGMLTAYGCGMYIGFPFIHKYGKYIGVTPERWNKVQNYYAHNARKTIIFGFYIPGIRQISPYFAGIAKISFVIYFCYALVGTIIWSCIFITFGYYLGDLVGVNIKYIPYLGLLFFVIYLLFVLIKYCKKKRK